MRGASAGKLDWNFDGTVSFPDAGKAKVNLLGFPIVGDASVKLGDQTAAVTVNVSLPAPFSAVSASPVLKTGMNTDLTLDGLSFDIAHVSVGPLLDIGPIHISLHRHRFDLRGVGEGVAADHRRAFERPVRRQDRLRRR